MLQARAVHKRAAQLLHSHYDAAKLHPNNHASTGTDPRVRWRAGARLSLALIVIVTRTALTARQFAVALNTIETKSISNSGGRRVLALSLCEFEPGCCNMTCTCVGQVRLCALYRKKMR
jgi:hypothetical protein